MSSTMTTKKAISKLQTIEPTIRQLLQLNRQTTILKEKLSQAEEYVSDIENDSADMQSRWRDKMANWWKMYALKGMITATRSTKAEPESSSSLSRENVNNISLMSTSSSIADIAVEQDKNIVLFEMQTVFGELERIEEMSERNRQDLNHLVVAIAKASKLSRTFSDYRLKGQLFEFAFEKMSTELQNDFRTEYGGRDRSIVHLSWWLKKQINSIWRTKFEKMRAEHVDTRIWCKYCLSVQHDCSICPDNGQVLCFRCYQFGHSQNRCSNESFFEL